MYLGTNQAPPWEKCYNLCVTPTKAGKKCTGNRTWDGIGKLVFHLLLVSLWAVLLHGPSVYTIICPNILNLMFWGPVLEVSIFWGIPKCDTVTLARAARTHTQSVILTLECENSLFSPLSYLPRLLTLILGLSHSHSVCHTHTQFVILTTRCPSAHIPPSTCSE